MTPLYVVSRPFFWLWSFIVDTFYPTEYIPTLYRHSVRFPPRPYFPVYSNPRLDDNHCRLDANANTVSMNHCDLTDDA